MKRKWIAGMLAAVMAFSAAGCGGQTDSEKTAQTESEGAGGEDGQEEPYTVTMVLQGTQQPDEERIEGKINEILEKELNAKLDIVVLPWASAKQQLQLMLSGDEKIDCFYSTGGDAAQYMRSGQIVDLSELVDEYGTNLKEVFGEDVLHSNAIGDFVYGLPVQIERGSIPAIFMRKDLVEKYQIDTSQIKEPKDMEKVFEVVQAGEPDMTMLYSSSTDDTPMSRLGSSDSLSDGLGVLMNQTENTTIENQYASDWYRDTIAMLHDWYEKGYISQDAGTSTVSEAGLLAVHPDLCQLLERRRLRMPDLYRHPDRY